jgi:hypothetical protein
MHPSATCVCGLELLVAPSVKCRRHVMGGFSAALLLARVYLLLSRAPAALKSLLELILEYLLLSRALLRALIDRRDDCEQRQGCRHDMPEPWRSSDSQEPY